MLDIPDEIKAQLLKILEGERSSIELAREILIVGPSFDVERHLFSASDEFLKIGHPILALENRESANPLMEELLAKMKMPEQPSPLKGRNRHEVRKQTALARRKKTFQML